MAINWARGLDELGTGLLRQADIGNKAYEGAMAKEAETRAANRAFAAEERAAKRDYEKEIRAAKARESEFGRSLQHDLDIAELGHGYSMAELEKRAELQRETDEVNYGRTVAHELKMWRMNRYAAVRDARDAATTAKGKLKVQNNVKRAESADKRVTSILTALGAAMKEGETAETDRLSRELMKAELQATEAWARIPGVDPLSTRKLTEHAKFSIVGKEIVSAISLRTPETTFGQAITAIKQGKGSSGYDAAIETVSRTIDDIIENDPTFKNYRGVEKRDLKKHIIENMLPNLELGEETADRNVVDEGNGALSPSFWRGSALDNIATDITKKDIGTAKKAKAVLDARPAGPGRVKSQEQKDLEKAQKRDPEYLLPHLQAEKIRIEKQLALPTYNPPRVQERLDKVNELISKFEALLGAEQAALTPAIPQETDINQSVVGVGGPASGMLSQGPGMIGAADMFGTDRMPMDAVSVNARHTA